MRTYLVTGGAGFIGSNYIHYMFRKYDNEIRIINVDALTYAGNLENLKDIENRDNYTFIKADITDKDAIMKIFEENDIDRVVHFAAESHVDRSIKNPEVFVKTNVLGTAVMLNCAKKAWELPDGSFKTGKKFLHVSTDEVYGSLPDDGKSYFYETTPYQPHSPYSASKASSDMLVKAYIDTYHFPANVTNTSNNYGPYQFPEKLIPLIINNALHGKKLPVYGDFFRKTVPVRIPATNPTRPNRAFPSPPARRRIIRNGHPRNIRHPIITNAPSVNLVTGAEPPLGRNSFLASEMIHAPSTRPMISGRIY